MTKKPISLTCPSCGAPLKTAAYETRVDCQYCHATIALPSGNMPPIIIQPPTLPNFQYKKPLLGGLALIIILPMVMAVIGVVIGAIAFFSSFNVGSSGISGQRIYSFSQMELVTDSSTEASQKLLGIAHNSDDTHKLSLMDFSQNPALRWQSADLGNESYLVKFKQKNDQVILVSKTSLSVLNKTDGIKKWETSLSDQLPNSCDSCLQISDDTVFALTQIGTLHAFDLATGRQKWSSTFDKWQNNLNVFNNYPVVVQEIDGRPAITVLDKDSGQIKESAEPQCPNYTFTDSPQEFTVNSRLVANGEYFYLMYGFWEPGCFEKWDGGSFSRIWRAELQEDIVHTNQEMIFTEEWIFFAKVYGSEIWETNSKNGDTRLFLKNEDFILRPLAFQDDILLVEASRTRGSTRYELWGYDRVSGQRLWQLIPKAPVSLDANVTTIIDESGVYDVHLNNDRLYLMQAFDEPANITFDVIDFRTGVSQGQNVYTLPEQVIFSLTRIGWQEQFVWVDVDELYGFDALTAQPVATYP